MGSVETVEQLCACGMPAAMDVHRHAPSCPQRQAAGALWRAPEEVESERVVTEPAAATIRTLTLDQVQQMTPAVEPEVLQDAEITIRVKPRPGLKFSLVVE